MKWISLITGMLLLAGTAHPQDSSDFLRAPQFTDLFKETNASQQHNLKPGNVMLSANERAELQRAPENARLRLPSLDEFTGNKEDSLDYKRIELFAPGATIRLIGPSGITLIKPGRRIFYLATNETTGIGLAVDPDSGSITGFASKGGENVEISSADGMNLEVVAVEPLPDGSDSCGTRVEDQQDFDLAGVLAGSARSLSAAPAGSSISYQTEIAIDTDNEWMAGKGNDETTAINFITEIFLAMNVFYERDVETRLLVGNVTLRILADPYTVETGRSAQLDSAGVTAEFNLNLLSRINRELDANFNLDAFRHKAIYNETESRIEMYLVSQQAQKVSIGDTLIKFVEGERILTEYSYKYELGRFAALAASAGFKAESIWTDENRHFSVQYLLRGEAVDS